MFTFLFLNIFRYLVTSKQAFGLFTLLEIKTVDWPKEKKCLSATVMEFWTFHEELTVMDDLIFNGERLGVPQILRSEMTKIIILGHMGIAE